jgi:hypothetical protein
MMVILGLFALPALAFGILAWSEMRGALHR